MKCRLVAVVFALSLVTSCQQEKRTYAVASPLTPSGFETAKQGIGQEKRTYEAACSLPPSGFGTAKEGIRHLAIILEITVDQAGATEWDGKPVSIEQLRSYILHYGQFELTAQLVLNPTATAPCKTVETVRAIMVGAEICKEGPLSCSEGRDPSKWPIVGGP